MTNQQHPLTPPPELVQEWREEPEFSALSPCTLVTVTTTKLQDIATRAAQWGADAELEACCELAGDDLVSAERLRAARRPKPPSLAEEALAAQQRMWCGMSNHGDWDLVRHALERLQELEEQQ